jgi:hypothetical protein
VPVQYQAMLITKEDLATIVVALRVAASETLNLPDRAQYAKLADHIEKGFNE